MAEKTATLTARSLGLLLRKYPKKILAAHGLRVRFLRSSKAILTWGRGKTYKRAVQLSTKTGHPVWTAEDPFLRSLFTGREGDAAHGLILDRVGVHYDPKSGSELKYEIGRAGDISDEERQVASDALALLQKLQLSKYNAFDLVDPDLPNDYVLVIDQVQGDASVTHGRISDAQFQTMLHAAIEDHPNVKILIKTHPETRAGKRRGYFSGSGKDGLISFYDKPVAPSTLFNNARAIYTVSSTTGLEAIFAGYRPVVFGRPFYAGWGLTDDRHPQEERRAWRKPEEIFHAAYQKLTLWYDPLLNRKSDFLNVAAQLYAEAENWRFASKAQVFFGIRLWKQSFLRRYFKRNSRPRWFYGSTTKAIKQAQKTSLPIYRWGLLGGKKLEYSASTANVPLVQIEDGFIRSMGLGAELRQPYSLVFDDLGIYFDARRPSRLEKLIEESVKLSALERKRASDLKTMILELGLSKYNLKKTKAPSFPTGKKLVLVLGQVADDASIKYGSDEISTNDDLLWAARQDFPKAHIIYKPHPDVVAGLRDGRISKEVLRATTDQVINNGDIADIIGRVDHVATISSLGGFEALLKGTPVTTYGAPFYAGWGLTRDKGTVPDRRTARPDITALTHAVLIDYPSYWDPVTERPCRPELLLERFARGEFGRTRPINRGLARVQNLFRNFAYLWR